MHLDMRIKTLRHWGVYVDEAYILWGGLSKDKVLKAAHIFLDDQKLISMVQVKLFICKVLYKTDSPLKKYENRFH